MAPLSGGEKARLALAMVVWQRPNLLVLDEPTNHLDLEMRHAMEVALQAYEGALLLVSHDRHLLRNTVEERKEKRQQAAAQRERLRPLKKQLAQTEADMAEVETELEAIQSRLGDADLYTEDRKAELADLLQRQGQLKTRAGDLEESWLLQQQELEELEQSE